MRARETRVRLGQSQVVGLARLGAKSRVFESRRATVRAQRLRTVTVVTAQNLSPAPPTVTVIPVENRRDRDRRAAGRGCRGRAERRPV